MGNGFVVWSLTCWLSVTLVADYSVINEEVTDHWKFFEAWERCRRLEGLLIFERDTHHSVCFWLRSSFKNSTTSVDVKPHLVSAARTAVVPGCCCCYDLWCRRCRLVKQAPLWSEVFIEGILTSDRPCCRWGSQQCSQALILTCNWDGLMFVLRCWCPRSTWCRVNRGSSHVEHIRCLYFSLSWELLIGSSRGAVKDDSKQGKVSTTALAPSRKSEASTLIGRPSLSDARLSWETCLPLLAIFIHYQLLVEMCWRSWIFEVVFDCVLGSVKIFEGI